MKIPERIKSQGLWWSVRYSSDIENLAETDYDTLSIIINENIPRELQEAAFFHEIGHTVNTTMEHAFMDSFLMQIFQVIKDNDL